MPARRGASVVKQPLEAGRRQLGVAHRVLDVLMPQIGLDRPRIGSLVRQFVARCMSQHVRVDLQIFHAGFGGHSLEHAAEARYGERGAAHADEHERRRRCFSLQLAQAAKLIAGQGMSCRISVLEAPDMDHAVREVDLAPLQVTQLARP